MIRWDAPLQLFERWVLEDGVEIAGRSVSIGQEVAMLFGSANRDPRRFPDPDRFDAGRGDTAHVGFGGGTHFCVGAPLARLELEVSLAGWPRVPGLQLAAEPSYTDVRNPGLRPSSSCLTLYRAADSPLNPPVRRLTASQRCPLQSDTRGASPPGGSPVVASEPDLGSVDLEHGRPSITTTHCLNCRYSTPPRGRVTISSPRRCARASLEALASGTRRRRRGIRGPRPCRSSQIDR